MIRTGSSTKLRAELVHLIETTLEKKRPQIDFLIKLNHLDDVLGNIHHQRPFISDLSEFLHANHQWLDKDGLTPVQKKRTAAILREIHGAISGTDDIEVSKTAETVQQWLYVLGDGKFKLVLKRPVESESIADRFVRHLEREAEEMRHLLERNDHIMTALNELLDLADSKTDPIYHHMAASLIYYLRLEGYRVDPYITKLKKIRQTGKGSDF